MNGSPNPHRSNRSSLPIVGVLIASILGAGVTRAWVLRQRDAIEDTRGTKTTSQANLSKLNSFALGLLLGGLRGPLVMALWTSSENQKSEKNLDDFDTKVDLIRLLQPEFDTVHLFQIWNKAYNISVQMANVPNKYTTILDALNYGFSVDSERPDNINILSSIGGLYFDKFGNAAEKGYYSPRLREETLPLQDVKIRMSFPADKKAEMLRVARFAGASSYALVTRDAATDGSRLSLTLTKGVANLLKAQNLPNVEFAERRNIKGDRKGAAGKSTEHPTLLDNDFHILPEFLKPRGGRTATGDAADGSTLPFLKEFEPYPLGVPPHALAYNYFKRCEWLQSNKGARHAQLSDRVISSRPALALKKWSDEDWYTGRRNEMELAGRAVPKDESLYEPVTADLALEADLPRCPLFDETIARYERASRVAGRAVEEYQAHNKRFPEDELNYRSHIKNAEAQSVLLKADALYLRAMKATGEDRKKLAAEANKAYVDAASLYTRHIFRYFADEEMMRKLLPHDIRNIKRVDVDSPTSLLRNNELPAILKQIRDAHIATHYQLADSEDFKEIDSYVLRSYTRQFKLALVK